MATVADIVSGVLVSELAADDDLIMNQLWNTKQRLLTNLLIKKKLRRRRLLQHLAYTTTSKSRQAALRKKKYLCGNNNDPSRDHDYVNGSVPMFGSDEFEEFRCHFKIERSTFDKIVCLVAPKFGNQEKSSLPLERKVLVAMWLLSSQESFRTIGDKFGLQKSTTYYAFVQFINAINSLAKAYLLWPDCESMELIGSEFGRLHNFPGVFGIVNSCHIPVKISSTEDVTEAKAEPYSTVVLQAVCDHRMRFMDVHIGNPQPAHAVTCTWKFFECSSVGKNLSSNEWDVPPGYFLLGDATYPLRTYLLTPYREDVDLPEEKKKFNDVHRSVCKIIHKAFGLLRTKFARIKYIDTSRHDLVPQIITATCVLHNIILEEEGEGELPCMAEDHDYNDEHVHPCPQTDHRIEDNAIMARDEISKIWL